MTSTYDWAIDAVEILKKLDTVVSIEERVVIDYEGFVVCTQRNRNSLEPKKKVDWVKEGF